MTVDSSARARPEPHGSRVRPSKRGYVASFVIALLSLCAPADAGAQTTSEEAAGVRSEGSAGLRGTEGTPRTRHRLRIALEGGLGVVVGGLVTTSDAALAPRNTFIFPFAGGVLYEALPWLDLRASLGVAGQTDAEYRPPGVPSGCSGRGRGALLDLVGTARLRPSTRIPLYFGFGVDLALGLSGGGAGPTCRYSSHAIPYLGGRFEYGFHFGPRDILDLGLRVRVLPSLGQVENGSLYFLEIYTGVAFGVSGLRPVDARPSRAATAAAIWLPTALGSLAVVTAVALVLAAAGR